VLIYPTFTFIFMAMLRSRKRQSRVFSKRVWWLGPGSGRARKSDRLL